MDSGGSPFVGAIVVFVTASRFDSQESPAGFLYAGRMGGMGDSILSNAAIDRRLLKLAAKYATAEEMSDGVLGKLTPAQCLDRVNELLTSKTQWDELQQRQLLLIQIAEQVAWFQDQRDNPKAWGAISRGLKILSDQVERTNINIDEVSTKLGAAHAAYMVEAFMLGFDRILKEMEERKVDEDVIDAEVVHELAEIGVNTAAEYVQRVTIVD